MRYKLYYPETCASCWRLAALTGRLDWFHQFELKTEDPPTGPLKAGEIQVVDKNGKVNTKQAARRIIMLHIPLYFPLGLVLFLLEQTKQRFSYRARGH